MHPQRESHAPLWPSTAPSYISTNLCVTRSPFANPCHDSAGAGLDGGRGTELQSIMSASKSPTPILLPRASSYSAVYPLALSDADDESRSENGCSGEAEHLVP